VRTLFAFIVAGSALISTTAVASEPAQASLSKGIYCLKLYAEGEEDCGFASLAQCNATASGLDGECYAVAPRAALQEPEASFLARPDVGLVTKWSDRRDQQQRE
jgi:Protein of unknown function (DUF3551)